MEKTPVKTYKSTPPETGALDSITKVGHSILQHGKCNDRIYLMSLKKSDLPQLISRMRKLVEEKGYGKIFAKVPRSVAHHFERERYEEEARVPNLFNGKEDGCFVSKFLSPARRKDVSCERVKEVLTTALGRANTVEKSTLPKNYRSRPCVPQDASAMAALYRSVFKTYPFPIQEPDYLRKTMEENVRYYGVWHKSELVALSSIELDQEHAYAEMTDFATHSGYQGQGLALHLLEKMENALPDLGVKTAYTIARATSYSMNITFSKKGYAYAGTLKNNTWISGRIESMNVWYKEVPNQGVPS